VQCSSSSMSSTNLSDDVLWPLPDVVLREAEHRPPECSQRGVLALVPLYVEQGGVMTVAVDLHDQRGIPVGRIDPGDPLVASQLHLVRHWRLSIGGEKSPEPALEVALGRDVVGASFLEQEPHRCDPTPTPTSQLVEATEQRIGPNETPAPRIVERSRQPPERKDGREIEQRPDRRRDPDPEVLDDVVRREETGGVRVRQSDRSRILLTPLDEDLEGQEPERRELPQARRRAVGQGGTRAGLGHSDGSQLQRRLGGTVEHQEPRSRHPPPSGGHEVSDASPGDTHRPQLMSTHHPVLASRQRPECSFR
jgi:hypothetical protein